MRMSKAQKRAEQEFHDAFRVAGNGIEFSVMDLGNLKSDTFAAIALGKTMEQAMGEAIAKYRKN